MPKGTSWKVSVQRKKKGKERVYRTEGLETKYSECQAAGTNSATLRSRFENRSGHGVFSATARKALSLSFHPLAFFYA